MPDPIHEMYKVLLIGLPQAGKTELAKQSAKKGFSEVYQATIGVDFEILDPFSFNIQNVDYKVSLQIYDVGGDPKYNTTKHKYFQGAAAVLIAIDLSETEKNKQFLETIFESYPELQDPSLTKLLVGTKGDTKAGQDNWQTNHKLMQNFAQEHPDFQVFNGTTSAKTFSNVTKVFNQLAETILTQTITANANIDKPISAPPNSSVKELNYNKFFDLNCLQEINAAITLTKENIAKVSTQENSANATIQLNDFKTSLENSRIKLIDIYLQCVPSKICKKVLSTDEELTVGEQKKWDASILKSKTADIKEVATQAFIIAETVSEQLKNPVTTRDKQKQLKKPPLKCEQSLV